MTHFVFLIRSSRSRSPRQGRCQKASSRCRIMALFNRLLLPSFRPFYVQGLEIVCSWTLTRCPSWPFNGLNHRNGFQGGMRCLLSNFRRFFCRVSVSFYLSTNHCTVRRTCILDLRKDRDFVGDPLLYKTRNI